jgi:hypothetical protein
MDVVTERSEARPPYRAYATIMGVYAGGLALSGAAARLLGRDPRDQTWLDLATLSAATFKAARTVVRDEVTSFIREPFVEGDPRDYEHEQSSRARGRGVRRRPRPSASTLSRKRANLVPFESVLPACAFDFPYSSPAVSPRS